jgi:hypothetical protein
MSYKKPYFTNSQKVDLFDINFEVGYISKQRELQERLKLINLTSKMANHYKQLNDKQQDGEKKEMFADFLDNVIALAKSNNQSQNYIIHNLDKVDYLNYEIRNLKSDVKILESALNTKNRIIKDMQK